MKRARLDGEEARREPGRDDAGRVVRRLLDVIPERRLGEVDARRTQLRGRGPERRLADECAVDAQKGRVRRFVADLHGGLAEEVVRAHPVDPAILRHVLEELRIAVVDGVGLEGDPAPREDERTFAEVELGARGQPVRRENVVLLLLRPGLAQVGDVCVEAVEERERARAIAHPRRGPRVRRRAGNVPQRVDPLRENGGREEQCESETDARDHARRIVQQLCPPELSRVRPGNST